MNQDRLLKVLVGPVISEKSTMVADKARQYTFEVVPEVRKSVRKAYVSLTEGQEINFAQEGK